MKRKKSNSEMIMVPIKFHPREIRAIKALAKKFAKNNFSAWIRHAGPRYIPKRSEIIQAVAVLPKKKKR